MVWPPDPPSRTLVHGGAAEAANEIPDQEMTLLGDDIPMIFFDDKDDGGSGQRYK